MSQLTIMTEENLEQYHELNKGYIDTAIQTVDDKVTVNTNDITTMKSQIDAMKTADTKDNTVSFESGDELVPDTFADVELLQSGEKHNSFWRKASLMFKNVRRLISLIGTTDISGIGNGTVTGAISEQNKKIKADVDNLLQNITECSNITEELRSGVVQVVATANDTTSVNVGFRKQYVLPPSVVCTLVSSYPQLHSISVSNITTDGFTVNLYRNANTEATIPVHWLALRT